MSVYMLPGTILTLNLAGAEDMCFYLFIIERMKQGVPLVFL